MCWFFTGSTTYKVPKESHKALAATSSSASTSSPSTIAPSTFGPSASASQVGFGTTAQHHHSVDDLARNIAKQLEHLRGGRGLISYALPGPEGMHDIIFDTGASFHIAPRASLVPGTTSASDGAITLSTAAGSRVYENMGDISVRPLGRLRAVEVDDGSPCALSVGRLVRDGFSFVWLADDPLHPVIYDREGAMIPLSVEADVPVYKDLVADAWAATAAAIAVPGVGHIGGQEATTGVASGVPHDGAATSTTARTNDAAASDAAITPTTKPATSYDEDGLALNGDQPNNTTTVADARQQSLDDAAWLEDGAQAHVDDAAWLEDGAQAHEEDDDVPPRPSTKWPKSKQGRHNMLTHRPSDPEHCKVCRDSKLSQIAARRVHEPTRASRFGELVHADTIGPLLPAHDGSRFVLVCHDDYSSWCCAVPLRKKESKGIARAFDGTFSFCKVTEVRTDPGTEFLGEFAKQAAYNRVKLTPTVTRRPQTNSRAERFHREVEGVVRAMLLQSGLPHGFWCDAMRMAVEHLNRVPDLKETTPHALRYEQESPLQLHPFGCAVRFLQDFINYGKKLSPRTKVGLCIGYHINRAIKVLDLAAYVEHNLVSVVTTRDYRVVHDSASGYDFPFVRLISATRLIADWSFEIDPETVASDERGAVEVCRFCSKPRADAYDLSHPCTACFVGRRRVNAKLHPAKHIDSPRCKLVRCLCADWVRDAVPELEVEPSTIIEGEVPDGVFDTAGLGAPAFGPCLDAAAKKYGLVTRAIAVNSEEAKSAAAQVAMQDALGLLTRKGVVSSYDEGVEEWQSVVSRLPNARVVRAHPILGEKNTEDESLRKYKARIVAGGNNVRNSIGQVITDPLDATPPTSLEGVRFALGLGSSFVGAQIIQIDIEAAYLHAPLLGEPYFMELPRSIWPKSWLQGSWRRPVVQILRALPGLTQSGTLWSNYARDVVFHCGWSAILDTTEDLYVKRVGDSMLLMVIYVDDLLMIGAPDLIAVELAKLGGGQDPTRNLAFDIGTVSRFGSLPRYQL